MNEIDVVVKSLSQTQKQTTTKKVLSQELFQGSIIEIPFLIRNEILTQ